MDRATEWRCCSRVALIRDSKARMLQRPAVPTRTCKEVQNVKADVAAVLAWATNFPEMVDSGRGWPPHCILLTAGEAEAALLESTRPRNSQLRLIETVRVLG